MGSDAGSTSARGTMPWTNPLADKVDWETTPGGGFSRVSRMDIG